MTIKRYRAVTYDPNGRRKETGDLMLKSDVFDHAKKLNEEIPSDQSIIIEEWERKGHITFRGEKDII